MPPVSPGQHVSTGEGGEIKIGSIRLQVVSGDITKEKTDAIVNGTNRHLDTSSGKDLEFNYLIKHGGGSRISHGGAAPIGGGWTSDAGAFL